MVIKQVFSLKNKNCFQKQYRNKPLILLLNGMKSLLHTYDSKHGNHWRESQSLHIKHDVKFGWFPHLSVGHFHIIFLLSRTFLVHFKTKLFAFLIS